MSFSSENSGHESIVNQAFSRQSSHFEKEEEGNEILLWMRGRVRKHLLAFLKPGARILELNAGTGLDAVYLARLGFRIHATDLASGMADEMKKKISPDIADRISVQECSYTRLEDVKEGAFDQIFSNFGGLNCVDDFTPIANKIPSLLKPGGHITLVIMPGFCPWELALLLKGNSKIALRRFRKGGSMAHLEGLHFMTYYFSPRQVERMFGEKFKRVKLEGLASLSPPPYLEHFPKRFPGLYRMLTSMDEKLSGTAPFNQWADHFILTLQYIP